MKTVIGRDFVSRTTSGAVPPADSAFVMPNRAFFRSAKTPLLRMQQPSAHGIQVGERRRDFQTVQVLGEAPVTDLLEAEYALDHPDRVLDLRANPRLGAVLRLLQLVDPPSAAVLAVGKVLRGRRPGADYGSLRPPTLVAAHA